MFFYNFENSWVLAGLHRKYICETFTKLPLHFFWLLVNWGICAAVRLNTDLMYLKHFRHDLIPPGLIHVKHPLGKPWVCLSSQGCLVVSPIANANRLGLDVVLALCPLRSFACWRRPKTTVPIIVSTSSPSLVWCVSKAELWRINH